MALASFPGSPLQQNIKITCMSCGFLPLSLSPQSVNSDFSVIWLHTNTPRKRACLHFCWFPTFCEDSVTWIYSVAWFLWPERCLPSTVLCWYNDINSSLANHLNNTVQTCHHSVCCCYNHLWGHLMIFYYCTGKTASGERTENHPGQSTINSLQQWHSEGWAWPACVCPKFVLLMCAQALVLLVQWLSLQQVPGPYRWPGYATGLQAAQTSTIIRPLCVVHHQYPEHHTVCMCTKTCRIHWHLSPLR